MARVLARAASPDAAGSRAAAANVASLVAEGAEVVTLTLDLGQPEALAAIRARPSGVRGPVLLPPCIPHRALPGLLGGR